MRMRWLAALLFAGGLAAGLGVSLTGTAHASDPSRPGKTWNEIFLPFGHGKGNTMCVDVAGGTTAPGTQLQLYHCHGYASDGAPQRWHFLGGGSPRCRTRTAACASASRQAAPPSTAPAWCRRDATMVPAWQPVRQSRDGADPHFVLETSGPGGPALCLTAGNLSDNNQTPLVAAACQGFGNAAEILELG